MIREALRKYTNSSSNAEKEWFYASSGAIPLTPSILKEFEQDVEEVYHTCSIDSLRRIIKQQGKRIELSTFTKGSYGIAHGALQTSEVLIVLKGKSSFDSPLDLGAGIDRNGHKWLGRYMGEDAFIETKFTQPMFDKIRDHFGMMPTDSIYDKVRNLSGKEKAAFVKWYYDKSKKILTKAFIKKLQKSAKTGKRGIFDNDEVLIHDFSIKNIYVIDDDKMDYDTKRREQLLKKLKIPYSGLISGDRLADIDGSIYF